MSDLHWIVRPGSADVEPNFAAHFGGPRPVLADRPWVSVGMIASLDGATAIGSGSAGLGNSNDRAALAALRATTPVVMVGAATAGVDGYHTVGRPGQRIAVLTNSGKVDASLGIFASGAGFVIAPEGVEVPDDLEVVRAGRTRVDLRAALGAIAATVPGTDFVVCEGGPTLNAAMLAADLIDEVCVTIAPMLVGGPSDRFIAASPREHVEPLRLVSAMMDAEGYQFQRWSRRG